MRILSFSGGGVRGVFGARILEKIESEFPNAFKNVDLYAGTSTGAILASGLSIGMTPTEMLAMYRRLLPQIFERPLTYKLKTGWGAWGPRYLADNLQKALDQTFGSRTLGDLSKHLIIPSFDLGGEGRPWKAKFFNTWQDKDVRIADALMCSAGSAPIYFPRFSFRGRKYIDGGIATNHPSVAAISNALNEYRGQASLDDIKLISIGSGVSPQHADPSRWWGVIKWALPALELLQSGQESVVDYQSKALLGPRYNRIQVSMTKDVKLDDVDQIEYMVTLANGFDLDQSDTRSFITGFWDQK